jgi:hypothetical protein
MVVIGVGRILERETRRIGGAAEQVALRALDAALDSALARAAVDAIVASKLVEHAVDAALRGPLLDAVAADVARHRVVQRLLDPLLEGEAIEQLIAAAEAADLPNRVADRLLQDGVADAAVARLLATEELWILVDEVARSPSVTEAISHQSAGLAEQMAEVVRDRSRSADARLERAARRVLGRPAPIDANGATRRPRT